MYVVSFLTLIDDKRKKLPVNMPGIRTMSITSGRILITDGHDHMTVLDPKELKFLEVWPNHDNDNK